MKKSFVSVLALLLVLLTACGQQTLPAEVSGGETDTQASAPQQQETPETLPAPAPEVQPKPEAQPQPEAEAEAEAEAEPEPEPQPEVEAEPEPAPQPEANSSAAAAGAAESPKENIQTESAPDTMSKPAVEWNHDFDGFPNYEGEKEGYSFNPVFGKYTPDGPGIVEQNQEQLDHGKLIQEQIQVLKDAGRWNRAASEFFDYSGKTGEILYPDWYIEAKENGHIIEIDGRIIFDGENEF